MLGNVLKKSTAVPPYLVLKPSLVLLSIMLRTDEIWIWMKFNRAFLGR